jgi:hypothetical protein
MANNSALQVSLNKSSGDFRVQYQAEVQAIGDAVRVKRGTKSFSRRGMIRIVTYLHPDFRDSIRLVQTKTGENQRETVTRALNTLFIEYNVPVVEEGTCAHDLPVD